MTLALTHDFSTLINTPEDWNLVQDNMNDILAWANGNIADADLAGNITAAKLAAAVNQQAGMNDGTTVRRGKSIIATAESRTNTAYGTLTTPDLVQNVVLPTDGILFVAFYGQWWEAVDSAARAAIFVGANQLKVDTLAGGVPTTTKEASLGTGSAFTIRPLVTYPLGLLGSGTGATSTANPVTTGQALSNGSNGGSCAIFAAAGTYDVSIQFKATSGAVHAANRKLWVWTMGF